MTVGVLTRLFSFDTIKIVFFASGKQGTESPTNLIL